MAKSEVVDYASVAVKPRRRYRFLFLFRRKDGGGVVDRTSGNFTPSPWGVFISNLLRESGRGSGTLPLVPSDDDDDKHRSRSRFSFLRRWFPKLKSRKSKTTETPPTTKTLSTASIGVALVSAVLRALNIVSSRYGVALGVVLWAMPLLCSFFNSSDLTCDNKPQNQRVNSKNSFISRLKKLMFWRKRRNHESPPPSASIEAPIFRILQNLSISSSSRKKGIGLGAVSLVLIGLLSPLISISSIDCASGTQFNLHTVPSSRHLHIDVTRFVFDHKWSAESWLAHKEEGSPTEFDPRKADLYYALFLNDGWRNLLVFFFSRNGDPKSGRHHDHAPRREVSGMCCEVSMRMFFTKLRINNRSVFHGMQLRMQFFPS